MDPNSLSAFLACRLIALDKCPGVRPIGICECGRILSKAILFVTKMSRKLLVCFLINTYREATELFVNDKTLYSEEGTTQGDPLAMPMYALAIVPLIEHLNIASNLKQVWYADDANACGSLSSL